MPDMALSRTHISRSWFDAVRHRVAEGSSSTLTWGQQFGYDGFGNLLTQTTLNGSAPPMSLTEPRNESRHQWGRRLRCFR